MVMDAGSASASVPAPVDLTVVARAAADEGMLPVVASVSRRLVPSVTTTWAWCRSRSTAAAVRLPDGDQSAVVRGGSDDHGPVEAGARPGAQLARGLHAHHDLSQPAVHNDRDVLMEGRHGRRLRARWCGQSRGSGSCCYYTDAVWSSRPGVPPRRHGRRVPVRWPTPPLPVRKDASAARMCSSVSESASRCIDHCQCPIATDVTMTMTMAGSTRSLTATPAPVRRPLIAMVAVSGCLPCGSRTRQRPVAV